MRRPEIWAGVECTLNRVGDKYSNQLDKSGHRNRLSDLQTFSELGIRKIRYPSLWEMAAPDDPFVMDWSWADERLPELKRLGITPIVGFLHHGSGPKYTSLVDPEFPHKLAHYARAFAERFPWVEDYTPINEINTTARFSCLYGYWYPHGKSPRLYLEAMLNQCRATVMAMQEIRKINPKAKLIQTDDLGKASSTPLLHYQRNFENERRWLSFDLLCGKVDLGHPLYEYFIDSGVEKEKIKWQQNHPCPPDVIGINHYHLSNRFLDHRMELYPTELHGGNGKHAYADVGAIDSGQAVPPLPEELILETWERFRIPVAVTEVHAHGAREAQMRWLKEVWESALSAQDKGAKVVAITVWSLLGTFDWDSLCTRDALIYESGVFDLRSFDKTLKMTALGHMIKKLIKGEELDYPVLEDEGCWRTPRRMLFGVSPNVFSSLTRKSRPILITGGGTLGQVFARICGERNIQYHLTTRRDVDIADKESVQKLINKVKPWAIINAAGFVKVDEAEEQAELCFRENVLGPVNLAQVCKDFSIPLVVFSSDLVFDGEREEGYLESHPINPLNVYGKSKAECEKKVLEIHPHSLVIRTSSFFGPWDEHNFLTLTLKSLQAGKEVHALSDVKVSPTYVPDLAATTLDLLMDGESGIFHLTNQGVLTWLELALKVAHMKNMDSSLIIGKTQADLRLKARRPKFSALLSQKQNILPDLENALERYLVKTYL